MLQDAPPRLRQLQGEVAAAHHLLHVGKRQLQRHLSTNKKDNKGKIQRAKGKDAIRGKDASR